MMIRGYQLKDIREGDLKTVRNWRNSERVKSFMYTDHHITWQEHLQWFQSVKNKPHEKVLVLHYLEQPLGLVHFSEIDFKNSRCCWGFYIGSDSAPKGSGTIMGILALDKIFGDENMHKVCAEVIHTNQKSIRYHEKFGFKKEGRLIRHLWKDNRYLDVIPMALFKSKWMKTRRKLLNHAGGGCGE